jgi:DNA-binding NarL/FixJ family response regulator
MKNLYVAGGNAGEPQLSAGERSLRVLVVDDHAIFRRGIIAELEALFGSAHVTEAASLAEALHSLRSAEFDAILLDLKLPDVTGTEGVMAVAAAAPHTPIVVISGSTSLHDVREATAAGARGYILKGSTIRTLKPALELVFAHEDYVFVPPWNP